MHEVRMKGIGKIIVFYRGKRLIGKGPKSDKFQVKE